MNYVVQLVNPVISTMALIESAVHVLNEYCLEHIVGFLNIGDRLNLGKAYPELKPTIKRVTGKEMFYFNDVYKSYPYWKVSEIFSEYGSAIRRMTMHFDEVQEIAELSYLIPRNFKNINEIYLNFSGYVDPKILEVIIESSRNIKIFRCNSRQLQNKHCFLIIELKQMEHLDIEGHPNITGIHLDKLRRLKFLDLRGCDKIKSEYFIKILRATKLTRLNIVECNDLNDKAFKTLVDTQSNLRDLAVNHCYEKGNVEIVSFLPNLRYVHINWQSDLLYKRTELLNNLGKFRQDSLRILQICNPKYFIQPERVGILNLRYLTRVGFYQDDDLSDRFLSQVCANCPKLQYVTIWDCRIITSQGIIELVKNLKRLRNLDLRHCRQFDNGLYMNIVDARITLEKPERLLLYVWGTSMQEEYFTVSAC